MNTEGNHYAAYPDTVIQKTKGWRDEWGSSSVRDSLFYNISLYYLYWAILVWFTIAKIKFCGEISIAKWVGVCLGWWIWIRKKVFLSWVCLAVKEWNFEDGSLIDRNWYNTVCHPRFAINTATMGFFGRLYGRKSKDNGTRIALIFFDACFLL